MFNSHLGWVSLKLGFGSPCIFVSILQLNTPSAGDVHKNVMVILTNDIPMCFIDTYQLNENTVRHQRNLL